MMEAPGSIFSSLTPDLSGSRPHSKPDPRDTGATTSGGISGHREMAALLKVAHGTCGPADKTSELISAIKLVPPTRLGWVIGIAL